MATEKESERFKKEIIYRRLSLTQACPSHRIQLDIHHTGKTLFDTFVFKTISRSRHSPIFPFGLPPPNTFSSSPVSSKRSSTSRQFHEPSSPQSEKHSKSKKSHIKKPLNAFMLFMKEQRAQVVQECTLRESAAINQILGRKVSMTPSKGQTERERCHSSGMNWIEMFNRSITTWLVMSE